MAADARALIALCEEAVTFRDIRAVDGAERVR
jgi:hypothetical protein